jgi:hypothetical protein
MTTPLELSGKSDKGQHVAVRASGIDENPQLHPHTVLAGSNRSSTSRIRLFQAKTFLVTPVSRPVTECLNDHRSAFD